MTKPRLVCPQAGDGDELDGMMQEWRSAGGRINPGLLRRYDGDCSAWLKMPEDEEAGGGNCVPQTLYFLKIGERLAGAVAIRHYLAQTTGSTAVTWHTACGPASVARIRQRSSRSRRREDGGDGD